MTGSDAHLAQGHAKQQLSSAQQKGGRTCDRLFVIPEREPGIYLSTWTDARWIPGSALTRRPGMTKKPYALSNRDSTYSQFTRFSTNALR
ncbi:hypothetical protein M2189_003978 [Bradyrhizobium japonicum]|nr:hypothetical protein [Bradyrhizobium japonicum]MCS3960775.1 hypothetical protein [Bradyrhizobium japonicum]MCS4002529.1 hypothetical protein [Bradyrhizobium japonicum]